MIHVMHNCLSRIIECFSVWYFCIFCAIICCVWFCYHRHHPHHLLLCIDFWLCRIKMYTLHRVSKNLKKFLPFNSTSQDRGAQQAAEYVSEWRVFQLLDKLRPTSAGTDGLPAWYLKLGASVFCGPVQNLFNQSIATSTVPTQLKQAVIRPVAKVTAPRSVKDYRPISVTPILTRIMERTVVHVRHFLYPAFQTLPPNLTFKDQFAFRPTGSTTSAITQFLHTITSMLANNP